VDKVLDRVERVLVEVEVEGRMGEAGVSMCLGRDALLLRRGSFR